MPLLDNGNDSALIMQFARGTEALQLADTLRQIAVNEKDARREASEHYANTCNRISAQYLGEVLSAIWMFDNRMAALDASSDDDDIDDGD